MAAAVAAGRDMLIKKATVAIAGIKVTGLSVDNTPIDITSNDSVGIQKLMAVSAKRAMTINVSGVETDGVLWAIAMGTGSQLLTDLTFVQPAAGSTADVVTCDWYMSNYKADGDTADAVQFSATFMSSGSWVAA